MFACANPLQVGVRILLSHLTAGHRRDHSFLGMPCPHGSHGCVELRCACSGSQPCGFIRRELAAFDHLVELLEDAYLVHISSPRSGIGLWSLLYPLGVYGHDISWRNVKTGGFMLLPEPWNRGVPLVGATDAVRTRWEVVARRRSPRSTRTHLSRKRHSDGNRPVPDGRRGRPLIGSGSPIRGVTAHRNDGDMDAWTKPITPKDGRSLGGFGVGAPKPVSRKRLGGPRWSTWLLVGLTIAPSRPNADNVYYVRYRRPVDPGEATLYPPPT